MNESNKIVRDGLLSRKYPSFQQQNSKSGNELFLVLGSLGAGKTTLMQNIAEYLTKKGESFEVIVNDIGNFNIDAERLAKYNPTALTQGCICCADLSSLKIELEKLKATGKKILIEPTGIATGQEIKRIAGELGMGSHVITLVNAEAQALVGPQQKEIINTQIKIADTIGMTHLSKDQAINEQTKHYIKTRNTQAPIFEILDPKTIENVSKEAVGNFNPQILEKQSHKPVFTYANAIDQAKHASFHTESLEISKDFSLEQLQDLIKQQGEVVIRAKGTISIQNQIFSFDYVQNPEYRITIGSPSDQFPHLNIISITPLDQNILENMKNLTHNTENLENNELSNIPVEKIYTPIQVAEKVNTLLKQYAEYMHMYAEKTALESEYQKQQTTETALKIEELGLALDQLGDDMKFDNPLVRLGYKRLAYAKDPAKKVDTIGSLLKHCERKTDICHKRLDFLNKNLKSQFDIDLFDEKKVNPDQELVDFLKENDFIQKLCSDEQFMQTWLEHEYFQIQGKVAKWQDYLGD